MKTQLTKTTPAPIRVMPLQTASRQTKAKSSKRSQLQKPLRMTSIRQIEANRRNALKSTGPKSETGKLHSRRNALRHGLTAETVIHVTEDPKDYKAFEVSVTADFDAQTAVERELVLRLASLLWRLRRATAIETGLLQIQSEILRETRQARRVQPLTDYRVLDPLLSWAASTPNFQPDQSFDNKKDCKLSSNRDGQNEVRYTAELPHTSNVEIARCFIRLANLDGGAFERLSRYETALWRQVCQILFTIETLQRRTLGFLRRTAPKSGQASASRYFPE